MSRNIINLGLLAVAALLASLVIWEPGQQQETINKLSPLHNNDINRIHIQRDALQDIQLEKQDGRWNMLTPYPLSADINRIKALLALVNTRSYTKFTVEGRKLANYGLEPIQAQVSFNDSLFQFGKLENISKRRYVLLDEEIHLITDLFYHQLRTSAAQFVSPELFNEEQRISRLKLVDHQYEQQQDGSWKMTPANNDISADKLNTFIENWQRLRATRVSTAGAQSSTERIHVDIADGKGLVFEILRDENETIFIRRATGLQSHIPSQVADVLFTPPSPHAAP